MKLELILSEGFCNSMLWNSPGPHQRCVAAWSRVTRQNAASEGNAARKDAANCFAS